MTQALLTQRLGTRFVTTMTSFVQHAYEKVMFPHSSSPYVVQGIVDLTQPSLWIAVASMYVSS